MFGIFYYHSQNQPVTMEVSSESKFYELCKSLPTDWALLVDRNNGSVISSYWIELDKEYP